MTPALIPASNTPKNDAPGGLDWSRNAARSALTALADDHIFGRRWSWRFCRWRGRRCRNTSWWSHRNLGSHISIPFQRIFGIQLSQLLRWAPSALVCFEKSLNHRAERAILHDRRKLCVAHRADVRPRHPLRETTATEVVQTGKQRDRIVQNVGAYTASHFLFQSIRKLRGSRIQGTGHFQLPRQSLSVVPKNKRNLLPGRHRARRQDLNQVSRT
mmetsp:Transcript_0/g.2  ORF Transcript_0/g.2 Transcript_0/m.2 type:complete len:215 (+) Transcript_0:92-736(+)